MAVLTSECFGRWSRLPLRNPGVTQIESDGVYRAEEWTWPYCFITSRTWYRLSVGLSTFSAVQRGTLWLIFISETASHGCSAGFKGTCGDRGSNRVWWRSSLMNQDTYSKRICRAKFFSPCRELRRRIFSTGWRLSLAFLHCASGSRSCLTPFRLGQIRFGFRMTKSISA